MGAYGWIPDVPDQRDRLFAVTHDELKRLPAHVDLRATCPPVYDQGQLGSCTANAIGAAVEFDLRKQGLPDLMPSRLFIYFNERAMEGTTSSDSGAQIRDGVKSVATLGVCPETEWPYDVARFAEKPSSSCYADALKTEALVYKRVPQIAHALQAVLAQGIPVVFGFTVYESFESAAVASSGVMPMPHFGEQVLGGHAVAMVGYDAHTRTFIVRNSWSSSWGQAGYFLMPFEYAISPQLASDFWAIYTVS